MTDGRGEREHPTPSGLGSAWSFDWRGAVGLVVLGVVALVAWRWIDGDSSGSRISESAATTSSLGEAPATGGTTTTVVRTTTTSPSPPTTATTTTIDPVPKVDIEGAIEPCRFGDACLVASFMISGFDEQPERYVCIYPNSRSDFGFNDDGKDAACFSGDEGDTIAIEVDGVVSKTISADDLDGTGSAGDPRDHADDPDDDPDGG